MNKYTFGIIGAGMIAEKHIEALKKTGRVNIKWVARQNQQALEEFCHRFSIPHGTTDYTEILNDKEVDAVVITTPPAQHKEMFIRSLQAGKNILLEKPAAISPAEIQAMLEERKKFPHLKVLDCSCRHTRLQPKFRFIKQIIDSGALGEIYYIHHNGVFRQGRPGIEYHPSAKWFLNKAMAGGGPLLDWGVYDLSFHLGLLNDKPELQQLCCSFARNELDKKDPGTSIYDVEEHGVTMMSFTEGLKWYWERAAHANMDVPHETRLYGTKGGIRFSFCSWDTSKVEIFSVDNDGRGKAKSEIHEVNMSQHPGDDEALALHFVDVLDEKAEPMMPLERAAKHLDIIFKVYQQAGM